MFKCCFILSHRGSDLEQHCNNCCKNNNCEAYLSCVSCGHSVIAVSVVSLAVCCLECGSSDDCGSTCLNGCLADRFAWLVCKLGWVAVASVVVELAHSCLNCVLAVVGCACQVEESSVLVLVLCKGVSVLLVCVSECDVIELVSTDCLEGIS